MTKFKVGDKVRLKAEYADYWSSQNIDLSGDQVITEILAGVGLAGFGNPPRGQVCFYRLELVPPAIDAAKKYKTRDGREVRIYATDGGGVYPVHGAIKNGAEWSQAAWLEDGASYNRDDTDPDDLIEVKPQHTRWLIVTPGIGYATKERAEGAVANLGNPEHCAVVAVTFTEGEGLEGGK